MYPFPSCWVSARQSRSFCFGKRNQNHVGRGMALRVPCGVYRHRRRANSWSLAGALPRGSSSAHQFSGVGCTARSCHQASGEECGRACSLALLSQCPPVHLSVDSCGRIVGIGKGVEMNVGSRICKNRFAPSL